MSRPLTLETWLCSLALLTAATACSNAEDSKCNAGSEGCACYGNQSCDEGLGCFSGLCVDTTKPAKGQQEAGTPQGDDAGEAISKPSPAGPSQPAPGVNESPGQDRDSGAQLSASIDGSDAGSESMSAPESTNPDSTTDQPTDPDSEPAPGGPTAAPEPTDAPSQPTVPDNSPDAGSPIPIDSSGGHPIVLLVAERGSSMLNEKDVDGTIVTGQWNDYPSRWDRVRELVAALEPYAGEIAFGALSYTGEGMVQCPVIAGTVEPATDDYDNLRAAFPPTDEVRPEVKGESPADAALQVAVDSLTALPNDRAKYILLFTRGTPDTCALPDPQCGGDNALHVIQTAFTSGIRTLVVGFNAADEPVANDLAQAGRGLPVRPPTEDEQTCLYTERSAEGLQFDFTDWRSYTAATYAADGYTYADDLTIPPDDTEAFLNVVEQIATGTF